MALLILKNKKTTQAACFFLVSTSVLLVYGFTLAPDLTWANYGSDGGELITAAVTSGIPHPPGYPTYTLLGRLFNHFPIGAAAYRFNLFSALSTATAAGFVAVISHQLSVNSNRQLITVYSSLVIGFTFAFAPLVWGQAIITEVYGLNLAALALFLLALLGKRPSLLTGLLLGLSITTHLTSALMLPLALLFTPRSQWPRLGLGMAVGLSPWLALPWLARSNSPVIWGDPTTLRGWWWLVSGQLYRPNLFTISSAELITRLREWGLILSNQFTWAGVPLIAYAFYDARGDVLRRRAGLLGTAVLYIIYALGYDSNDAIVFTLPAFLLLALLLPPGFRRLGRLAFLLPLTLLLLNYGAMDLSDDETIRPSVDQLLNTAPDNAILLTPGDATIFSLWYGQHVTGQRSDLILADANLFAFDWYRERLQQLYPDLRGLGADDLTTFQQVNGETRPFCTAALQPSIQLDCDTIHE